MRTSDRDRGRTAFLAVMAATLVLTTSVAAQTTTQTVLSAEDWVFVSLSAEEPVVAVTNPATSDAWDIAFQGTSVMVNGDAAGPGGVTAACICQNLWATNDELQLMSPTTELADFESVTAATIPADITWHPATFAATPWFKYNLRDEHMIWPTYNVYLLKRGETIYKFQVIGYYGPTGDPRHVTYRYERIAG